MFHAFWGGCLCGRWAYGRVGIVAGLVCCVGVVLVGLDDRCWVRGGARCGMGRW